jgi:hypothetical protein
MPEWRRVRRRPHGNGAVSCRRHSALHANAHGWQSPAIAAILPRPEQDGGSVICLWWAAGSDPKTQVDVSTIAFIAGKMIYSNLYAVHEGDHTLNELFDRQQGNVAQNARVNGG